MGVSKLANPPPHGWFSLSLHVELPKTGHPKKTTQFGFHFGFPLNQPKNTTLHKVGDSKLGSPAARCFGTCKHPSRVELCPSRCFPLGNGPQNWILAQKARGPVSDTPTRLCLEQPQASQIGGSLSALNRNSTETNLFKRSLFGSQATTTTRHAAGTKW